MNSDQLLIDPTIQMLALDMLRDLVKHFNNLNLWSQSLKHLWLDRSSGEIHVPELTLYERTAVFTRLFMIYTDYVRAAMCLLRPSDRIYIILNVHMLIAVRSSMKEWRDETLYKLFGLIFISGLINDEVFRGLNESEVRQWMQIIALY